MRNLSSSGAVVALCDRIVRELCDKRTALRSPED
jgi:hypothetical protein